MLGVSVAGVNRKHRVARIDTFDFEPGRRIAGKYEVVSKLGQGWEGEVYKIVEVRTGVERTAKLFYPQRNVKNRASKFYAKKLHKLRQCPILIQYHTEEIIQVRRIPVTVLVSEFVEGELLPDFLATFPGKRLSPYVGMLLLYALVRGIEPIHLMNEYHGDLHAANVIVNRFGIGFDLKLVDVYPLQGPKHHSRREDLFDLIYIFHQSLGGTRYYANQPKAVKDICCGLKRSLILHKFRTLSQLRKHIEDLAW